MRWKLGLDPKLLHNPELQSAVVRLAIWAFGLAYIGLGSYTGYYQVDVPYFLVLFTLFLGIALTLLVSVLRRRESTRRRYLGLLIDILATSLVIQLTQEAISPFYLFYIWIFISAGTRYGRSYLSFAALVSVIAYNMVLIALDHWARHPFEAAFFLLLLIALPLYQHSLLQRIQQARAEAERANRAKSDFLAFMTHELRTPLTGVIGMTDLLKTTALNGEQHDYVLAISRSADLLKTLIGDVLDLSRIDAHKLQLEQTPFDLRETIKEICALIEPLALDKGLELIPRVDPKLPARVVGDPLRVRQILLNLVGNAVKFTEQGEIELGAQPRPAEASVQAPHILLEVRDTGIGIPAAKLATIFEGFRQVDESTTRRFGGSGLGTTISRDLAQLMGGAIGVASEEGRGSRFWVRLPLPAAACERAAAAEERPLRGLRALVCERNLTYRTLIAAHLRGAGITCTAIGDLEALQNAARPKADLIVVADAPEPLDLATACRQLHDRLGGEVPCLCLTYAGRRLEPTGICMAQLNKPFLGEELVASVHKLLFSHTPSESAAGPPPTPRGIEQPGRLARRIRVLVAEDNEIAAKVITAFLKRQGCSVVHVEDGEQALEQTRRGDFDIAFIDLRMPKIDGIDFTRRLRRNEVDQRLPIVALTADAAEETKAGCLDAGMDDFLCKPVRPAELEEVVARWVPAAQAAGGHRP